jgi:protease-4
VFGWLGWLALLLCLPVILGMVAAYRDYYDTSQGIQERYHSLSRQARDKVAVIDVSGVVMDGEGFVKRQIDRVRQDQNVRALVVRINSPGGTITGSDYIYHHLCELREERDLPLVVSMGSMAASGGYYIAMAVGDTEESVFAEPTTTTGSIGVIIPHYDLSGLLEKLDVKDDSIVTHPRKQMLSMTKPLSDEDRQILEEYINDAFQRFKDVVKQGRPQFQDNDEALDELATGEIFVATQAQQSGLVDRLGFVEDAIDRAIELAGLEKANVRVVSYKQPLTLSSLLASAQTRHASDGWSEWLQLTSPRAYYLCTSLPPLASSWRR